MTAQELSEATGLPYAIDGPGYIVGDNVHLNNLREVECYLAGYKQHIDDLQEAHR